MSEKYHELKVIMYDKKVSQKQLADHLNITEQSLNSKLNDRSEFTVVEADKTAKFLEIEDPTPIFFKSFLRATQKI